MSWDLNQVILIGRLTKDIELRYGQSGAAYSRMGLAINRKSYREGEPDDVYYIDIVSFGKLAELASQYLSKGKQVGIQGYLRQNRWSGQDGQKYSKVEVVAERMQFLSPLDRGKPQTSSVENNKDQSQKNQNEEVIIDDEDEDIPF